MNTIDLKDLMLMNRPIDLGTNITIGVIGCGGTGSLFVRDAARIINVFNEKRIAAGQNTKINRVFFADADIVEDKNLVRQNFIGQDIGRNKAEVLAERYSSAFNLDIDVIPDFIESEKALYDLITGNNPYNYGLRYSTVILFSMVDNVKTRLMISNFVNGYMDSQHGEAIGLPFDVVVVDCGNSEFAGQVCVSATRKSATRFYLPTVAQLQPDLLDSSNWDKFASEQSCEEAAVSDPQSISANGTAANIAMNVLYNLLFKGSINYNKVVFNSQNNTNVTSFLRSGANRQSNTIGRIDYNNISVEKVDEVV